MEGSKKDSDLGKNGFVIDTGGLNLRIPSVAGTGTCICIQNWKIAVDMGICPNYAMKTEHVFITHPHLDHISALPIHVQQRAFLSLPKATYYIQSALIPLVEDVLKAYKKLDPSRIEYKLKEMDFDAQDSFAVSTENLKGNEVKIAVAGGVVRVKPFKTIHRVESQGYLFLKTVSVLKEEYKGLDSAKIRELIQSGKDIKETTEVVEIAVTGDTTMEGLLLNPLCFQAKILITECTYIDEASSIEQTQSRGHLHLDEILANAHLFQNKHIVLMHFSNRYSAPEIQDKIAAKLQAKLTPKVHLALESFYRD